MDSTPSLFWRAALAVLLMVGFYAFAFSIVGVLLFIPYAEIAYVQQVNYVTAKIGFFCIAGALIILWSILPRIDWFIPPGLIVHPSDHPKLFQMLRQIGEVTSQSLPAEVYITNDLNAWVTNRGGVMGFGSRRVMGIGLPLMAVLSTSQLRAVIAHEFGHYYSGDTKLGPWIYKTRAAIGRTIYELERNESSLRILFQYYAIAFLRITHAISRRQEFAADALAARTVGVRPLVEGLKVLHTNSQAFAPYFLNEVVPIIQNGFLPPLVEGFRYYTVSPEIAKALSEDLNRSVAESTSNSYNTHPSLQERMLAVQNWSQGVSDETPEAALSLLENAEAVEERLMRAIVKLNPGQELKQIHWDEVGSKVWLPVWDAQVKPFVAQVSGLTVEKLPGLCRNPALFSFRSDHLGNELAPETQRQVGILTLGAALALALHAANWKLHISPGTPVSLEDNGRSVRPFVVVRDLSIGLITEQSWRLLVASCGIGDLPLATQSVRLSAVNESPVTTPTGSC